MSITAAQVKDLREKTGLGMMACKKALTDANGDVDKAIETLRKQGQATAAKRAGRDAKEGKISIVTKDNSAVLYEVNSETDFVARNDDFIKFSEDLGTLLIETKPTDLDAALNLKSDIFGGVTVSEKITDLIGKIGEKISFKKFSVISCDNDNERIFTYIHGDGRIGVAVKISADKPDVLGKSELSDLGKDLAMQIAAVNPQALTKDDVPAELIEKEKDIYLTQAKSSGRPEKVWDKIVDGKIAKFLKEIVLLEQSFIKDPDISVTDRIKQTEKDVSASLKLVSFERFELGA